MLESVRRLLQLGASGQVAVVLPGHNQVSSRIGIREACSTADIFSGCSSGLVAGY